MTTWGSFQDNAEVMLFGLATALIAVGLEEDEEEVTDVTLGLRVRVISSSVLGLGGVGVLRKCVRMARGAF